jgi:hypothetical protein
MLGLFAAGFSARVVAGLQELGVECRSDVGFVKEDELIAIAAGALSTIQVSG